METVQVVNAYDRRKNPEVLTLRKCTMEDLSAMAHGEYYSTIKMLDRTGKARDIRPNGKMQTWKRDPNRFERSFSYGLYEHFRLTTQEMLDALLFPV